MPNFDSTIQSIQMIIGNLEENLYDCRYALRNGLPGKRATQKQIIEIEKDIEEHKEAIIALQMVASGKLRVI